MKLINYKKYVKQARSYINGKSKIDMTHTDNIILLSKEFDLIYDYTRIYLQKIIIHINSRFNWHIFQNITKTGTILQIE